MSQKPKIIQVIGTSSSAGKSTIAMALCRYFAGLGLKVAPFKAVNMSLNSVSIEGGYEIARSQWLQAFAARTEPVKEMNPFLLKPEGDTTSQVIALGKSLGKMSHEIYSRFLSENGKIIVRQSLEKLVSEYDIVVAEGAGSASEINLYNVDLSNMYVSSINGTPALLVADIERGGVFASIYGTVQLMEHPDLLKWFMINNMRGSTGILESGISRMETMTGKKFIGVMPHIDFRLPGEDSLDYATERVKGAKVCVIKYPQMENYSDVDALYLSGIGVRFVSGPDKEALDLCESIILPGSKNVERDLAFLRETGLDSLILKQANLGKKILGICGGFQMLGNEITDEKHLQIQSGKTTGLGLLDCSTEYAGEKIVKPVKYLIRNKHIPGRAEYHGYEIHYGRVHGSELAFAEINGNAEGAISENGRIIGTNIHGILEAPEFLGYLTGVESVFNYKMELERNIDKFTKAFIEHVDLSSIKSTLL